MHALQWACAHRAQALVIVAGIATALGTVRNVLTRIGAISPAAGAKLGQLADWLSWVAEHGKVGVAGGWLSMPGFASKPPLEAPKSGGAPPPVAGIVPLLLISAVLASGCHGFDWKKFAVDEAQCAASPVKDALAAASNDLVDAIEKQIAGGNGFDSQAWADEAKALGTHYGFDVIACSAEHLIGDALLAGPDQVCHLQHRRARPSHLPYLRKLLPKR